MARLALRSERFDVAELAMDTLLREKPGTSEAEFLLGIAIQKQKRYGEARGHFERAILLRQRYPESDHVFHFLGWCLYNLGELPQAAAAFREHLRRVPGFADSIFGLGVIALDEDRLDEAEARFREAIRLQEGDPDAKRDEAKAWARLSDLLVRTDRFEEAEQALIRAVTLYPNHYEAWAKLARVLDRLDQPERAERARQEERNAMERVGRLAPSAEAPGSIPAPAGAETESP